MRTPAYRFCRNLFLFLFCSCFSLVVFGQPVEITYNGISLWVYPEDNHAGISWGGYGIDVIAGYGALNDTNGAPNTVAIVEQLGAGNYAAYLCDTLSAYGHSDWYLPSRDELHALYQNKDVIGGFGTGLYLSSRERNLYNAYGRDFSTGAEDNWINKGNSLPIRCVRRANPIANMTVSVKKYKFYDDPNFLGVEVVVKGGSGLFSYNWNNGASEPIIIGLSPGSYSVTITDNPTAEVFIDTYTIDSDASVMNLIPFEDDTLWVFPVDNSDGMVWGGAGTIIDAGNGAWSDTDGAQNSLSIVTQLGPGDYAAYHCDTLTTYGYTDWYLPSKEEMFSLSQGRNSIVNYTNAHYFTSTQSAENTAWRISSYGNRWRENKISNLHVRCVRRKEYLKELSLSLFPYKLFNDPALLGATVTVEGGSGFFSYEWNNGDTLQDISDLLPGTYTITVTDNFTSEVIIDSITVDATAINKNLLLFNGDSLWVHPVDNHTNIAWSLENTEVISGYGARSDTSGVTNTLAIVDHYGTGNYAAYFCDTLRAYGYDDWYLPAISELNALYLNKDMLGGFKKEDYWSSTETGETTAYWLDFRNGVLFHPGQKNNEKPLRCIRKESYLDSFFLTPHINRLYPIENARYIELSLAGGSGIFSYQWSNDISGKTLNNLPEGSYTVTVTDLSTTQTFVETYVIDETSRLSNVLVVNDNELMWVPPTDHAANIPWGGYETFISGTNYNDGLQNTSKIVEKLSAGNYAAYRCDTLSSHNYTDWYLPAIDELDFIIQRADSLSGTFKDFYWSSTEYSFNRANYYRVLLKNYTRAMKNNTTNYFVRCIRKQTLNDISITLDTIIRTVLPETNQGKIRINVSGGSGSYSYSWDNGATTRDILDLTAGTYRIVVSDNYSSRTATDSFMVKELLPLQTYDTICEGDTAYFKGNEFVTAGSYDVLVEGEEAAPDTAYQLDVEIIGTHHDQICVVTIDLETGKNMVVWERTRYQYTDYYNVYRETALQGVYAKIGEVPFDSISLFVDMGSNPEQQQNLYKTTTVNVCGVESQLSESYAHKTMLLQYAGSVGGINLSWSNRYEIDNSPLFFDSYIIYRGSDSVSLTPIDTISGSFLAYIDNDPVASSQGMFYRIAGERSAICAPADLFKASSGPFSQSISNIEDNRLREGSDVQQVNNPVTAFEVYPNPFREMLNIKYTLASAGEVLIELYDMLGNKLSTIDAGYKKPGSYQLSSKVSQPGIYLLKIQKGKTVTVKKVVRM